MMKRLNRLHKLWKLSKKDERKLALMLEIPDVVLKQIPDDVPDEPGAFFPEASVKDHKDMEDEESGMKAWYERLKQP